MKVYKVVFTSGYEDDLDSLQKGLRCDVLIIDEKDRYFNPQYITIERVRGEFNSRQLCYLEENLVIMNEVTQKTIFETIPELHRWLFFDRWVPVSTTILEKYFYPKETWDIYTILVEEA